MIPCPVCEGFCFIEAPSDDSRTVVHECWRCDGEGWIDDEEEDGPGDSLVPAPKPPPGPAQAWADWNAELMRRAIDDDDYDEEAP